MHSVASVRVEHSLSHLGDFGDSGATRSFRYRTVQYGPGRSWTVTSSTGPPPLANQVGRHQQGEFD